MQLLPDRALQYLMEEEKGGKRERVSEKGKLVYLSVQTNSISSFGQDQHH